MSTCPVRIALLLAGLARREPCPHLVAAAFALLDGRSLRCRS